MAEQVQMEDMDFNTKRGELILMENQQQNEGWEISLPKFLWSPLVWAFIVGVLVFGAYKLLSGSGQPSSNQTAIETAKQESAAASKTLGFFKKVSDTPVTQEDKPYFLYVGAQFCPFCAAERWSLVKALQNFGTWSGLESDTSADEEAGFSKIPTYSFVNAKYESQYISYGHKETADRNGNPIPGQELTEFEKKWFNQYDPRGGVPFLFLNGQYVQLSSGFSPGLLSGKTYDQVKTDVDGNANIPYIAAINKEADIITAYLCKATSNQPTNVCNDPKITQLIAQIP